MLEQEVESLKSPMDQIIFVYQRNHLGNTRYVSLQKPLSAKAKKDAKVLFVYCWHDLGLNKTEFYNLLMRVKRVIRNYRGDPEGLVKRLDRIIYPPPEPIQHLHQELLLNQ